MYLLKIAWRNLARNKIRTLIAIFSITAVVMIVILARGLTVGMSETIFQRYIDNNFGHVRITDQEYKLKESVLPLDYTINGLNSSLEEMLVEVEKIDEVQYLLPRIRFGALASIDNQAVRMMGVGVDSKRESDYGALLEDIKQGRMPERGNEILVGEGLLEKLQIDIGESVTLIISDAYQSLRGKSFEVVGVRETGVAKLDNNFFYLPLETAQDVLWLEDEVTEILAFGPNARIADDLETEISSLLTEKELDTYSTEVWNQADPLIELYDRVIKLTNFAYALFILMGTVGIVSALKMIIRERTSEIGILAALGLKSREIMQIFLLEGALMGLIGSLLGVIAGGLITFYYSQVGLSVEVFAQAMLELDVLVEPVFYFGFNLDNLIFSFMFSFLIVTLACFHPVYKILKFEPIDALYYINE